MHESKASLKAHHLSKISHDTKSQGAVHTKAEKFENAAFFLRLDLLSTPIRHENAVF